MSHSQKQPEISYDVGTSMLIWIMSVVFGSLMCVFLDSFAELGSFFHSFIGIMYISGVFSIPSLIVGIVTIALARRWINNLSVRYLVIAATALIASLGPYLYLGVLDEIIEEAPLNVLSYVMATQIAIFLVRFRIFKRIPEHAEEKS